MSSGTEFFISSGAIVLIAVFLHHLVFKKEKQNKK